jgi:uncharacterized membrane protein YccC
MNKIRAIEEAGNRALKRIFATLAVVGGGALIALAVLYQLAGNSPLLMWILPPFVVFLSAAMVLVHRKHSRELDAIRADRSGQ